MTRSMKRKAKHDMTNAIATTKRNAKKNDTNARVYPLPLKSLHDDIMRDNANATITTKKMRVKLRVALRDEHTHNQTWMIANARDYDRIRSMFDAKYATSIATPPRVRKPRAKKNDATSNVETIDANA